MIESLFTIVIVTFILLAIFTVIFFTAMFLVRVGVDRLLESID